MTRNKQRPPTRWGRLLLLGALAAAIALAILYLRCGGGFGIGGGGGLGGGKGSGQVRPAVSTPDGGVPRCQIRITGEGIAVDGATMDEPAAVAACRKAGAADVVITGDARQGTWDQLRVALEGAAVTVFVRTGPGAPATDARP